MTRAPIANFSDRLRLPPRFKIAAGTAGNRHAQPLMAGYLRSNDERRRWRRPLRYLITFFAIIFYAFIILLLPRQVMLPFLLPVLALFGMVIWAMPVTNKPPPKALDTLFWVYFGTLFLWPNYLALTIPGLPWITFARLLCAPMVLILLWCASTSQPFKDHMAKARHAMPWMIGLIAAFSVLQVISIGFSDLLFLTINRVFNNLITWTAVFFAALWVFRDIRKIDTWINGYLVMTAVLCIMAIFEASAGGVLWAGSVPGFLKPPDPLIDEILAGSYRLTGQYRVQATQTTPLSLAEMTSMAIPMMAYFIAKHRTVLSVVAMVVLDGLIINTLLQADARLGFVSILLGHLLALLYFGIQSWRARKSSLIGPAITLMYPAMILVTVLAVTLIGRIRVRVLGSGQHQGSNDAREEQWRLGMTKIWESPIFGFGADRGGEKVGFYSPGGDLTIDSYYLSILMDYGFVGFALFYGLVIYAVVKGVLWLKDNRFAERAMVMAMTIFLFQFLVIKSVLSQAANQPLTFMVFGAMAALAIAIRTDRGEVLRPRGSGSAHFYHSAPSRAG